MKKKLISMVEFVLTHKELEDNDPWAFSSSIVRYATFLNTPLNLGMFVPAIEVDGKWEVLEEPNTLDQSDPYIEAIHAKTNLKQWQQYKQAKDKVIFEGVRGVNVYQYMNVCKTIDDLTRLKKQFIPTLTEKGLEVSGLNR